MAEKPVILLVEDETDVMLANQEYLENCAMGVLVADSIAEARLHLAKSRVDLVVLDVNLPDGSGLDFVKEIGENGDIPVIFLTCRTDKDDIIKGLKSGGCDYITKPYHLDVLYARINAQLRNSGIVFRSRIMMGSLELDITQSRVFIEGKDALLKPKEFSLLLFLIKNAGAVLSDEQIYSGVWGQDTAGDTRTVRVHIHSLRKKLMLSEGQPPYIETIPQKGYRIITGKYSFEQ